MPEINALLDKPWLLAMILAIGAICGIVVERLIEGQKRAERRAFWQGRNSIKAVDGPGRKSPGSTDQLRIVLAAQFSPRPLLNKPERRLLSHLDRALAEESPGWRAMGQVSLGEILASSSDEAYRAINSKRVDLLIIDVDCRPLHAIEFQGDGHHQPGNAAAARDAVKKEALRRAGIGYVEIVSGDTPADVREMVRKLVARAASG